MSSAAYPIPSEPHNVLQMTHNMLATENVTVTQLWATTFVPTSSPVSALVMLVAPQHTWFLMKSLIINFTQSLQPTQANAAQFSVDSKVFLLSFHDVAMFWCFKYMVLLGVRSAVSGCTFFLIIGFSQAKYVLAVVAFQNTMIKEFWHQLVKGYSPKHSPPWSQSEGGTQSPDGMDANRRLHTPQSQSTTIGNSAGHTVRHHHSQPLDPDPSFDGGESSSDHTETICQKKRKLI
ncbi:hypothetical protein M404DRAFT_10779 [Pisolithus tinctorius Marx 270]|uniref:Uncharacterized protein n=1 Tax=Pisolithus tinctorius Marx 270 TaxID=870435 RepID=A0A0C3N8K0_PISTI|nr:hypothetical protein M404DRAFT_10779 [Pisolithus tinctorius Marx 270]